jgi:hypothetical protein
MSPDKSNIVRVMLSDYTPVAANEKEDRGGWVRFGDNNLFPEYLEEMAASSPVHGALCTSISQMVAGDGVVGLSEIQAKQFGITDKFIDKTARDLKIQGWYCWELKPSISGEGIVKIEHLPITQVRLAKSDDDDEITGVYYCRDWSNQRKYKPVFIPLWNGRPATEEDAEGNAIPRTSAYVSFLNDPAAKYYGMPDYWPSINAIELSRQISIYHVNNILNGLFPAFIVNFLNGIPDPDEKTKIIQEWERHASGARNAGKAFFTFGDPNTTAPQITTFPISDADKQYQFLSEESTRLIMVGHRVVSPLLFGIRDTGGGLGSNSDELRQALAIFTANTIKPMQQNIVEGLEEVTKITGLSIKPYVINGIVDDVITTDTTAADEDVASSALNGAQIASLVEIVTQVAVGAIPKESARAIVEASFPTLTAEQVASIFNSITEGGIQPEEVLQSAILSALMLGQKKKPELNQADADAWLNKLRDAGETIDLEEWELVHEDEAGDHETESDLNEKYRGLELSLESYANGDEKSKHGDAGLHKLRYAYSQNLSADSRPFCVEMVGLSQAGKVYRYEDIQAMGDAGENGQFAPEGSSTYDIFLWKGGAFCHHFWKRQIYLRKRAANGRILPNDGLKNDKRVGNVPFVPQKGKEGIAPINTPTRGSIKYG